MAKKWLATIDKWAKKGSNAGGKLGLISKAVDAIIPDATTDEAKEVKALADTNTGAGLKSMNKASDTGTGGDSNANAGNDKGGDEKVTLSQKWGRSPLWLKVVIIVAIVTGVWYMMKGKKRRGRR